ncbi:hypothetical protein A2U01_0088941, partial [Trifolium medium]|nr:hypothetical protein [Trifolium medium]
GSVAERACRQLSPLLARKLEIFCVASSAAR